MNTPSILPFLTGDNNPYSSFKVGNFLYRNFFNFPEEVSKKNALLFEHFLTLLECGALYAAFRYGNFRCYFCSIYSKDTKYNCVNCGSLTTASAGALILGDINVKKILASYTDSSDVSDFSLFLDLISLDISIVFQNYSLFS